MLVDYTNQRRAAGESIRTALIQANHARLRPILMTTIAMVFGMFPMHQLLEQEQNGKTAEALAHDKTHIIRKLSLSRYMHGSINTKFT
jgi:multidrug efflux pump subunit AcrB